jgi:AraC-like DNA-binding protein
VSKLTIGTQRTLDEAGFLAALHDPRTRIEFVQAGQSQAYPQWIVQRRVIPEHLIYLVTAHTLEGHVAGRAVRLEPGGFVWVMPGVQHDFRIPTGRPAFSMIHFKIGIFGPRQAALRAPRGCITMPNATELQSRCADVIREAHRQGRFADLRARSALLLLLSEVLALTNVSGNQERAFTGRQRAILADYVCAHLAQHPRPAELAALLRLSNDYFTREFRRTYGMPPRAWLLRERMNAAARRLAESQSTISEIADELGYSDVFLFSRQFKNSFGHSPRAFRRAPSNGP